MDFERKTTVWVGVEDAFDFFADPANMPLYVPTVTLEEAIAVDGDPESEPDTEAGAGGPQATFVPDRNEHRVTWSLPGVKYQRLDRGQARDGEHSDLLIRVHTADDVDAEQVRQMIEQVVRTLGRHLSGR